MNPAMRERVRITYWPIEGDWSEVASWSVFAVRSDTTRACQRDLSPRAGDRRV